MGKGDARNLLIAIVIVLCILAIVLFVPQKTEPSAVPFENIADELADVEVVVPDIESPVTLSSGSAQLPPDGSGGTVTINPPFTKVGDDDYFAVMAVNYGGSGVFEYLVMFSKGGSGESIQSGIYSLGDRVKVESIVAGGSGDSYPVTVKYLDYSENESYADEPTVSKTVELQVEDHQIVENSPTP